MFPLLSESPPEHKGSPLTAFEGALPAKKGQDLLGEGLVFEAGLAFDPGDVGDGAKPCHLPAGVLPGGSPDLFQCLLEGRLPDDVGDHLGIPHGPERRQCGIVSRLEETGHLLGKSRLEHCFQAAADPGLQLFLRPPDPDDHGSKRPVGKAVALLPRGEPFTRKVVDFQCPGEPVGVIGMDLRCGIGIDALQQAVKSAGRKGGGIFQPAAKVRAGRRGRAETLENGLEIEPGSPHEKRDHPSHIETGQELYDFLPVTPRAERLVRIRQVDEVVTDAANLVGGGLGGADIEAPVDLAGVDVDDFGAEGLCDRDRKFRLPGCGRTDEGDDGFPILLAGSLHIRSPPTVYPPACTLPVAWETREFVLLGGPSAENPLVMEDTARLQWIAMSGTGKVSSASRFFITAASFVIVIAGLKAAAPIVVPFLLSAFLAIICTPFLFWMQRRRVPTVLAVLVVVLLLVAVGSVLILIVGTSLTGFLSSIPSYQQRFQQQTADLLAWIAGFGIDISADVMKKRFDPGTVMQMVGNLLTSLTAVLANAFMILLTVVFILFEASGLPLKLRAAMGDPEASLGHYKEFLESVNRYLAIKTTISIFTGITVAIWLTVLKVDYPLLWGLVAFLMNYIPNIGSLIASIPAILLGFIQYGFGSALLVAAGYLFANTLFGSFIEPRFMGRGLGLSTLVVFVSLVFWGWILGPVGMLLSVLLTMIVKIALESRTETRWIAILLGSTPQDGRVGGSGA